MNEQICALILKVLGALDGPEVEHLRAQAQEITVTGGPITMSDLSVPTGCPRADVRDGLVPVRAFAYNPAAQPLGDIMVWVENGYLATLEYAWVTEDRPSDLPLPGSLELRVNPESLDAWSATHEGA